MNAYYERILIGHIFIGLALNFLAYAHWIRARGSPMATKILALAVAFLICPCFFVGAGFAIVPFTLIIVHGIEHSPAMVAFNLILVAIAYSIAKIFIQSRVPEHQDQSGGIG